MNRRELKATIAARRRELASLRRSAAQIHQQIDLAVAALNSAQAMLNKLDEETEPAAGEKQISGE